MKMNADEYYEIKMQNGDVFKTFQSIDKWHCTELRTIPFLDTFTIIDIRTCKEVYLAISQISSIRLVPMFDEDPIEEDKKNELIRKTQETTAATVGPILTPMFDALSKRLQ